VLGTRRCSLGGLGLAAGLGLALVPPAGAFDRGYLSVGIFSSGPVKGLTILQRTGERRARGTASLSGLTAGARYTVAWVKRPCSRTVASPSASGQAVAIETIEIAHEGLSFVTRPIALTGSLTQVRSARVWDDAGRAVACAGIVGLAKGTYDATAKTVFSGRVHGALVAFHRREASAGRMYLSLGGLDPDSSYRVIASRRPCGRAYTNSSRVFTTSVPAASNGFVFQKIEFFGLRNTRAAKSLRVFSRTPRGPAAQETCAAYSKLAF
jgi:hypothetical protein